MANNIKSLDVDPEIKDWHAIDLMAYGKRRD